MKVQLLDQAKQAFAGYSKQTQILHNNIIIIYKHNVVILKNSVEIIYKLDHFKYKSSMDMSLPTSETLPVIKIFVILD